MRLTYKVGCDQYVFNEGGLVGTLDGSPIANGYGEYTVGSLNGSTLIRHQDGTLDGSLTALTCNKDQYVGTKDGSLGEDHSNSHNLIDEKLLDDLSIKYLKDNFDIDDIIVNSTHAE